MKNRTTRNLIVNNQKNKNMKITTKSLEIKNKKILRKLNSSSPKTIDYSKSQVNLILVNEKFGRILDDTCQSEYFQMENEIHTNPNLERNRIDISKIDSRINYSQRFDINSSKISSLNFNEKESK